LNAVARGWFWRLIGIEPSLLVAAAVHVACLVGLTALAASEVLSSQWPDYLWMALLGMAGASATLLAAWAVLGPGRLAMRCLWAVALVAATWLTATRIVDKDGLDKEILTAVTAGLCLFAGSLALAVCAAARLGGGFRVSCQGGSLPETSERWQFRLADLLIAMLIAALVLLARKYLRELSIMYYRTGDGVEASIVYAIRCGAAQATTIALAGIVLLLVPRPRLAVWLVVALAATGAAVVVMWLPTSPPMGELSAMAGIYASLGVGAAITTVATLLALRARGWRVTRSRNRAGRDRLGQPLPRHTAWTARPAEPRGSIRHPSRPPTAPA